MGAEESMRVVIDTNVIVSVLLFGGVPAQLITLWKNKTITPLVSSEIMAEYLRVLAYAKFRLTEDEINALLTGEILPWFEVITASKGSPFVTLDPDDDKFIWCAMAGKAACIISGDEHLLACAASPVSIVTANAFLHQLG